MEITRKISKLIENSSKHGTLRIAFFIAIASVIHFLVDKYCFEYANKKAQNNFATYSYQFEQTKEEVLSQYKLISDSKLREKVDLDGTDKKHKIDATFDNDVKVLFDEYQTLIRKLRMSGVHVANVMNETISLLPGAFSQIDEETKDKVNDSVSKAAEAFSWLNKFEDKIQEQIQMRNQAIDIATNDQSGESQLDLIINNLKLLESLFSDEYSLLKRNHDPEIDISRFMGASLFLLNNYNFIVEKHNQRVEADNRNKSLVLFGIYLFIIWLNFRKDTHTN